MIQVLIRGETRARKGCVFLLLLLFFSFLPPSQPNDLPSNVEILFLSNERGGGGGGALYRGVRNVHKFGR